MGSVTRLKPQAVQWGASILPNRNGGYTAVVQSPAGQWMVLAGSWRYAPVVREFLERHGYLMISPSVAQAQIDKQGGP